MVRFSGAMAKSGRRGISKLVALLPDYRWYYSVLITLTSLKSNDSASIVKIHPETGLVCGTN